MCYVGNQSSSFLLGFVIIPHTIYLLIGLCFMAAGFGAVCQYGHQSPVALPANHRPMLQPLPMARAVSQQQPTSGKGETLMIRIGIFSSVYLVPSVCVLASHWYEYISRDSWMLKATASVSSISRPSMEVFMLKIFMSFVAGLACCVWIWGPKTLSTWQKLGRRLLHRKQAPPPFLQPVLLKQQHVLLLDNKQHNKRVKNGSKSGSETAV